MERLEAMRIFLRVAELASFTRAADTLGLPKANVSLAVQQLEDLTGTRLLHRTTRKVSLSQDGLAFYERCRDLVAEHEEVEGMFRASQGRLRVDLPHRLAASLVVPRLPEFLARQPGLQLELSSTDRRVDLITEGFDCVLRVGALPTAGLQTRPLGFLEVANCASPAYVQQHGWPQSPADLVHHQLVHYAVTLGSRPFGFEYLDGDVYRTVDVPGRLTVNSTETYLAACLAGLGIIQVPRVGVRSLLAAGDLVEVLPDSVAEPMPMVLLYPARRHLSRRLRAFMEWLEEVLRAYR